MVQENITVSFTSTQIAEFNDFAQGTIGPASTLFSDIPSVNKIGPAATLFADIASVNKIGPAATLFTDIVSLNKLGPAAGLSASGLESLLLTSDIIHCSESGQFNLDNLELYDSLVLRGNNQSETLVLKMFKVKVIESVVDRILLLNESNSVCINNDAGGLSTWSLPTPDIAGLTYTFVKTSSSGVFRIKTKDDSLTIVNSSGVSVSGIELDSIGSKLSVISDDSNGWVTYNSKNITSI